MLALFKDVGDCYTVEYKVGKDKATASPFSISDKEFKALELARRTTHAIEYNTDTKGRTRIPIEFITLYVKVETKDGRSCIKTVTIDNN